MEKLDGKTRDIVRDNINKLKEIFPEAFTENKIDFEKLQEILGEDIEKGREIYEFTWPGKSEALRLSQKTSTGTLRPNKASSKDWENTKNLYIEGDNLEVLKLLQRSYYKKVKMIYIDPPYNTGNDFVYKDDFRDNIKNYKELTLQSMKANPETSGRYHSDWLNMMYPRLRLAKNLLSDDGVIFISIDDNEVHNLRKVCDEIFGETNFRNTILVRRRIKSLNSQFADEGLFSLNVGFEYVLVYAKSQSFLMKALRMGKVNAPKKGRWDVFWSNADRPTMRYDLLGFTPKTGQWRNSKDRAITSVENYELYLEKYASFMSLEEYWENTGCKLSFIRRIQGGTGKNGGVQHWVPPSDTALRTSNWTDIEISQIGKEIDLSFDNPKNKDFIIELIKLIWLCEKDIILDFFSGSATTAHAVMQLNAEDGGNRQFIMVQLPEPIDEDSEAYKAGYKNISEIGMERIRRAGEKIKEENKDKEGIENLDIGFKVLKLDSSNIKLWDSSPDNLEEHLWDMVNPIKEDRTDGDIICEIMVKYGIDMTLNIEKIMVAGKKAYSIGKGYLIVCLDKDITLDVVEEIGKQKPERAVFLDTGFADDNVKINAVQILKKFDVEDFRSI